jgi:hypothetical protein
MQRKKQLEITSAQYSNEMCELSNWFEIQTYPKVQENDNSYFQNQAYVITSGGKEDARIFSC